MLCIKVSKSGRAKVYIQSVSYFMLTHVGIIVVSLGVTRWNGWMVLFYTLVMVGVHVLHFLDIFESAASIRACAKD